jgi:N-acetylglucosaminyldiphosphoundecaprenol N-acetyl-beta-D-mannosaminyltransferase
MPPLQRAEILGTALNLITRDELLLEIASSIAERSRLLITNHNMHSVYLWHTNAAVRRFYDSADIVHVDGMPLIFAGRMLGLRTSKAQRIAYIDWLPELLSHCAKRKWSVMFVASAPGVAEKAAQKFREQFPGLSLRADNGFFCDEHESPECEAVLQKICHFSPDILILGMGMPRQELWADRVRHRLQVPVILTSAGATLDYFAGVIPTPPRWSGSIGLEWLFRLVVEPRRLWRRYLLEPIVVLSILLTRKVPPVRPRQH